VFSIFDGVVKTLHPESRTLAYLVRCYNFSIITTYLMYAEIIEKLHASNMKLFTYPSNIKVFTTSSNIKVFTTQSNFSCLTKQSGLICFFPGEVCEFAAKVSISCSFEVDWPQKV